MALSLHLNLDVKASDPEDPDSEQVALWMATEEIRDMAHRLKRRLEEQGIVVTKITAR